VAEVVEGLTRRQHQSFGLENLKFTRNSYGEMGVGETKVRGFCWDWFGFIVGAGGVLLVEVAILMGMSDAYGGEMISARPRMAVDPNRRRGGPLLVFASRLPELLAAKKPAKVIAKKAAQAGASRGSSVSNTVRSP